MSGDIVHDFSSWAKDIGRRVELLERRRQRGIGASERAIWVTQTMTFTGGVATVTAPQKAALSGTVVASFAQQVGGPLNGAVLSGSTVTCYAAVPDGDYLVSLVYGVP